MVDDVTTAVVGGGPAGMMLGLLLAKAGVDVAVFEKHRDFLRDFRGDTVHPSTMELIDELGLTEQFRKIPQGRLQRLALREDLQIGSLAELPLKYPYIAIAPQWDFLNMLAAEAQRYARFQLLMEAEVVGLLRDRDRIIGVQYRDRASQIREHRCVLTVAADGRHSTVRAKSGLPVRTFGAPFDVLWFRLPKRDPNAEELYFRVAPFRWIVGFDRRTYVQMAYIIKKGTRDQVRAAGIESFRRSIAETIPELADRVHDLKSFDDVKFLEVQVNRARRWHLPGLLLIGDAAHAMSPMGGVGVNYAIQDAVAAANILSPALVRSQQDGTRIPESLLHAVQRRRALPTAVIQGLQRVAQSRLVEPALHGRASAVPKFAKMMQRFGPLRRLFLRLLSVGIRQEHIHIQLEQPDLRRRSA
jgi:2-polyprenyl-6-methoxyphenol hydroxylase-like FAD-dependent oxidoreductase